MAKIAISLSGGGYRAATYHLGTLSYLNHLHTSDGRSLLDHISAVSTISGGTLSGLMFLWGKCKGLTNEEMLQDLYSLLMKGDLIGRASTEFLCGENLNNSLIREMVRIYDEEIFHGATLGDLMDKIDNTTIDDFTANATDFNNSQEFLFQIGKEIKIEKGETAKGVIGNSSYKIPLPIASQIHLSEVFAASSCFPAGFEPLFFPRDFQLSRSPENEEYLKTVPTMPLMDGGVVDNQGIEPIVMLRRRKDLDLYIVSDATRGQKDPYDYKESSILDYLTVHKVNVTLNIIILFLIQFLFWVPRGTLFGFFLGLTFIFLVFRLATALSSRRLLKRYSKQIPFRFNWKGLLNIPLSKYINLIGSRASSMLELTDKVFMDHIRSLNYYTIYSDVKWQNRRIMSALYELATGEVWGKHLKEDERAFMNPGDEINKAADTATSMGTTLWWSDEDIKEGKPEALIATGQFNICWNLLEYIYRLRRNNSNLNENHQAIIDLLPQLEEDWEKFKKDPYWMTRIFQ